MNTGPQPFSQTLSFPTGPMFHFHHYSQENRLAFPDLNLNNTSNKSSSDQGDQSPFNKDPDFADLSDSFFDTQNWSQVDLASSPSGLSPLEEDFYGPKQQNEYDDMIKNFLLSGVSENSKIILKKTLSSESKLSSSSSDQSQRKKRQTWRPDEDRLVLKLIEEHGQSWKHISKLMINRTGKQIRDRYMNVLMPTIKKSSWTSQEDELILSLYQEYGSKWRQIAQELQGRTESQIKNRFHTHLKGIYTKRFLVKKTTDCEEKVNKNPLFPINACETSSTGIESPISRNSFETNEKISQFVDMMFSFTLD